MCHLRKMMVVVMSLIESSAFALGIESNLGCAPLGGSLFLGGLKLALLYYPSHL